MKRLIPLFLSVLLLTAALPPVSATGEGTNLPLSCASCVLMEKETGSLLYERDPHAKLAPASVTKIMTLLLVMEAVDSGRLALEDTVTVSATAAGMGGSQVYLKEGEQMSVSELIKCVTVVSGNDCAVALAEHLAGSETAFVDQMNQRAKELGMENTTFLNCTGLPAEGHLTTAYDIALMSRELMRRHPSIREYTTIWLDTIRDGTFGLTNTNRLIRFYPGATGLKTGSTDAALYCMSATAERDGMELIAVIMKAPTTAQRFEDAKTLLDFGFAGYTLTDVYPDAPLPPVSVSLGELAQVQPQLQQPCRLLLSKAEAGQVTTQVTLAENLEAPVEKNQTLGQFQVFVGGQLRQTIPIISAQDAPRLTVPRIFSDLLRQLLMAR